MNCLRCISIFIFALLLLVGCQSNRQMAPVKPVTSLTAFKPDYEKAEKHAHELIMKLDKQINTGCHQRSVIRKRTHFNRYNPENYYDGASRRDVWDIKSCNDEVSYIVNYETRFKLPNSLNTSVRIKPLSGSIPEHAYVMNLAERNECEITAELKKYKKRNSNSRIYHVPCRGSIMKFECTKGRCWRL